MGFDHFQTLNSGSLAAAASVTKEYAPEKNEVIKAIMAKDRNATEKEHLVDLYMKIAGDPIVDPSLGAGFLGTDPETALKTELELSKGTKLSVKFTNNHTAAVDMDLVLEMWTP